MDEAGGPVRPAAQNPLKRLRFKGFIVFPGLKLWGMPLRILHTVSSAVIPRDPYTGRQNAG